MHHKKRRGKNAGGGSKLGSYWKIQGIRRESKIFESLSSHKRRISSKQEIDDYLKNPTGL